MKAPFPQYPHALPERHAMRRIRHLHFIGIGGAGMGGIAEVLLNLGYRVSGSDLHASAMTAHLARLGATIYIGHQADHVRGCDAVVVSSAIAADNPELQTARAARIPVVPRAEMLAELMRFRYGIAIAGTHGKTTTTSLIASLLAEAGHDPTFVIGGLLNSAGSNARLGTGPYLVAEADESDASFLYLQPMIAVVTNIDADHLPTYGGSFERLRETFITFLHHLPFYGLAVLCLEDPEVRALVPRIHRPIVTYGFTNDCDVQACAVVQQGLQMNFQMRIGDTAPVAMTLNLPGRYSVLNALAAMAVAHELGVTLPVMQRALRYFQGVGRRFQQRGEWRLPHGSVTVIEDYGHHPREIAVVLAALRAGWPTRRLVLAFQPHRYTRTRDLFAEFAAVLATADVVVLTEIYAASEPPLPDVTGFALYQAVQARRSGHVESGAVGNRIESDDFGNFIESSHDCHFVAQVRQLLEVLPAWLRDGDVLLLMGAGSIGSVAEELGQRIIAAENVP